MASQSPRKHAKKPSFFKVLIRDFSTRLKIPPAFMKEFGKDMSKKTSTLIETYNGRSWEVEVEKLGNKFYFNSGWHKFVEDNNLETGDFLVFKYFADYSKFKVKIFGKTCCEKQSNVVVEERPCEPLNGKVDRQRNAQEGTKRRRNEEEEDDDDDIARSKKTEFDRSKAFERNIINIDSDSSSESDEEGGIGGIQETKAETMKSKRNRKHRNLPSDYNDQIYFTSENPFFQLQLKYSTANFYIHIPTNFLRKHTKELMNKRIKFQISQKTWNVKLLVPKRAVDSQHKKEARVTKEWKKLAKEYHLKEGDVCIFEIIKSDDFDCVFRLHVYRWDNKREEFCKLI